MVLLRYTSISRFAQDLKAKPRLALIAGFEPHDVPVAGSFYHFIDRLEDGRYQKPCEHRIKQSKLRKGKHLRNLASEIDNAVYDCGHDATGIYEYLMDSRINPVIALNPGLAHIHHPLEH